MMKVGHHRMSNYYKEKETWLLHQLLVRRWILVADMNPATIEVNNLNLEY
jgi:hypothetical protein